MTGPEALAKMLCGLTVRQLCEPFVEYRLNFETEPTFARKHGRGIWLYSTHIPVVFLMATDLEVVHG